MNMKRLGTQMARLWLRSRGYSLDRPPAITDMVPDAYGTSMKDGAAIVAVEPASSLLLSEARERMIHCVAWKRLDQGRRVAVLLVPQHAKQAAAAALPMYDALVGF